ncbi:MAG: NAD(P)/FAD-dependent oxidoreductase [Ruminococcaceae bacterium]|nr:NAD(P)/FAD-dependent oxidoreductase [Oscillospiraceae bacterium]
MYDVIVVGGGAAGMFSAIVAARRGKRVLLMERNDRLGKKLRITGKGRCNVTNACSAEEVLQNIPKNNRFLYSAVTAFPPEKVMSFFEELGCPLKVERGNRVFPVSDSAQSVLDALGKALRQEKVEVHHCRVERLLLEDGNVTGVVAGGQEYHASGVILTTGGCSYPLTGSTGDGYEMAKACGHTIVEPVGSLVPMESVEDDCARMQGLSLRNVAVKLLNEKGKVVYKDFGELLFTHFGVSGPTVLSASAHMGKPGKYTLSVDLKPALEETKLDERILRDLDQYKNRAMINALTDLLPRTMIPVVLNRCGIPEELPANSLTKAQRRILLETVKGFRITIKGKRPVAEAIITSGGIKVSEVDPKTMASKLVGGLYFAGEILDCDAYTGGFNLQIAWSTANSAAQTI